MVSPEENETLFRREVLAIACVGNPSKGNPPGHAVHVFTQISDDGQWMTFEGAIQRYPGLRFLSDGFSGANYLCNDCSQLEEI